MIRAISGEVIDLLDINKINDKLREKRKNLLYLKYCLVLLKHHYKQLFISAASFQETTSFN